MLILNGCQSGKLESIPNLTVPPQVVYTSPREEPRCGCDDSRGAYATNTNSFPQQMLYIITTKDNSSDVTLPIDPAIQATIPAGTPSAPGKYFLGCTVHAPSTSCRFHASHKIISYSKLVFNRGLDALKYGTVDAPSIASCQAWCSNPSHPQSGACLTLGARLYRSVEPVIKAVTTAQSSGGVVKREKVLELFRLSSADDKCERGDITTSDGKIVNEGKTEACMIRSQELPRPRPGQTDILSAAPNTMQMVTSIQKRLEATPRGFIKELNSDDTVEYEQSDSAPIITFEGPGGARQTAAFGGHMLGSGRIISPDGVKQTVIATENGCIALDEQ